MSDTLAILREEERRLMRQLSAVRTRISRANPLHELPDLDELIRDVLSLHMDIMSTTWEAEGKR